MIKNDFTDYLFTLINEAENFFVDEQGANSKTKVDADIVKSAVDFWLATVFYFFSKLLMSLCVVCKRPMHFQLIF